jgi:hypothetical protein
MADQGSEIRPPQQQPGVPTSIPVEHRLQLQRQELGLVGYIFGSKENARENGPFFIASIIIILSFIGIFVVLIKSIKDNGDVLKGLSALIVAALTFIGGGSGRTR